eukprot:2184453-Pleurochrysis_carterae.AAC.2
MDLAHEVEYAGHPTLKLFTRPEEMESGQYMRMSKDDISYMNSTDGKKITHETLRPETAQKRGAKDRTETQTVVKHIWSAARTGIGGDIQKQKETSDCTTRKVRLNQRDKLQAVEQGVLTGRFKETPPQQQKRNYLPYSQYSKRCRHNKSWVTIVMQRLGS